jgi:hypothetical protein
MAQAKKKQNYLEENNIFNPKQYFGSKQVARDQVESK